MYFILTKHKKLWFIVTCVTWYSGTNTQGKILKINEVHKVVILKYPNSRGLILHHLKVHYQPSGYLFHIRFHSVFLKKIYLLFSANSHFSLKQVQLKEIHYQLMEISIGWCHIWKSILSKFFKKLFFLF